MSIKFTKMHGLGNDFIVIDGINQSIHLDPAQIASLALRHTGIGFDQCLLIESSVREGIDFQYRIFNADGHEVNQCGNGARCLALFAKRSGLTTKNCITVATKNTLMQLQINEDNTVTVGMGMPKLNPSDIPFLAEHRAQEYTLVLKDNKKVRIHAIGLGNPHAVLLVPNVNTAAVQLLGQEISEHPDFPEQTNVGFMQIISPSHIALRVYERGCAETQACGSGAVAAAAIGRLYHRLSERITVSLPGGDLMVQWLNEASPIFLTGPGTFVYDGVIDSLL